MIVSGTFVGPSNFAKHGDVQVQITVADGQIRLHVEIGTKGGGFAVMIVKGAWGQLQQLVESANWIKLL